MKLDIKSLGGIISLDVEPQETILDIKHKVEEQEPGFQVWKQRILDPDTGDILDDSQMIDRTELALVLDNETCVPRLDHLLQKEMKSQTVKDDFVSSQRYCFMLRSVRRTLVGRTINGYRIINGFGNHINVLLDNGREFRFPIRSGMVVKGVLKYCEYEFGGDFVEDEYDQYVHPFLIMKPEQIYIKNATPYEQELLDRMRREEAIELLFDYDNIIPCRETSFTGRKRSLRRYIRRSIKKELKKLSRRYHK